MLGHPLALRGRAWLCSLDKIGCVGFRKEARVRAAQLLKHLLSMDSGCQSGLSLRKLLKYACLDCVVQLDRQNFLQHVVAIEVPCEIVNDYLNAIDHLTLGSKRRQDGLVLSLTL